MFQIISYLSDHQLAKINKEKVKVKVNKCNNQNFRKKFIVDNIAIIDETQIVQSFNKFFTKIGPKFAIKIKIPTIKLEEHLEQCDTI